MVVSNKYLFSDSIVKYLKDRVFLGMSIIRHALIFERMARIQNPWMVIRIGSLIWKGCGVKQRNGTMSMMIFGNSDCASRSSLQCDPRKPKYVNARSATVIDFDEVISIKKHNGGWIVHFLEDQEIKKYPSLYPALTWYPLSEGEVESMRKANRNIKVTQI